MGTSAPETSRAARDGVVWAAAPELAAFRVCGPARENFLHGLLSSDVRALPPGEGQWSCLLTPFLLETEDGARRILRGIAAGRRIVHFPWQLSLFVMYFLHNLPGFLYDRLVQRYARYKKRPYRAPRDIDSRRGGD